MTTERSPCRGAPPPSFNRSPRDGECPPWPIFLRLRPDVPLLSVAAAGKKPPGGRRPATARRQGANFPSPTARTSPSAGFGRHARRVASSLRLPALSLAPSSPLIWKRPSCERANPAKAGDAKPRTYTLREYGGRATERVRRPRSTGAFFLCRRVAHGMAGKGGRHARRFCDGSRPLPVTGTRGRRRGAGPCPAAPLAATTDP